MNFENYQPTGLNDIGTREILLGKYAIGYPKKLFQYKNKRQRSVNKVTMAHGYYKKILSDRRTQVLIGPVLF